MNELIRTRTIKAVNYKDRVVIEVNGIEVAVVSLDDWRTGMEGDVWLLVTPVEHHTPDHNWPQYKITGCISRSTVAERYEMNETIGRLMLATITDTHMKGSYR
jgi:hypothetical protein